MTVRSVLFLLALSGALRAALFEFPSENDALVRGPSGEFYMYVNRDFEGKRTTPWQGGQYGYVRGPKRIGGTVVFTAIHEGIDIRPIRRDADGNPRDVARASADGTVVYVNPRAGASNYGKYVVVEHRIGGSPIYTIYAHLAYPSVEAGDRVKQGQTLGMMGFTGSGIDRTRAHLHFETALMLNPGFASWHAKTFPGEPNAHGNFNGRNLVGFDPSEVLLASRKNPDTFDPRTHIRNMEAWFKVAIPAPADLPLLRMYPWLLDGPAPQRPPGWEISFSRYGVPVRITPFPRPISQPVVTWVRETNLPDASSSRGLVSTTGSRPTLTQSGRQMIDLICAPAE